MLGLTEFLVNSGIGVISFFGGRHWEKRDDRDRILNEKIEKLVSDISELSNLASKYYIQPGDERTTAAETALIGSAFRRINIDLHSICLVAKIGNSEVLGVLRGFHDAVTAEPFGSKIVKPIDANSSRIIKIQSAEAYFVRRLRTLERI